MTMKSTHHSVGSVEFRRSGAYSKRISNGRAMDQVQWAEAFKPLQNPRTKGLFFDPDHPDDAAFLGAIGESRIWTDFDISIDGSDIEFVVLPGRYEVDRAGHMVTVIPWNIHQVDLIVPWQYPR